MPSWIADIRILFYADASATNLLLPKPGVNLRGQEEEFGLRILKDILEASISPRISVDLRNRYWTLNSDGGIGDNTFPKGTPEILSSALLDQYDEIWLFGKHLGNFDDYNNSANGGTGYYNFAGAPPGSCAPEILFPDDNGFTSSELLPSELTALRDWMNTRGGGVLILGDHSNPARYDFPPYKQGDLLNLGRAMGSQVHRAGKMRRWEGLPDAKSFIVNTSGDTPDMTCMENQADAVPQYIQPLTWAINVPGTGYSELAWHPLFAGSLDLDALHSMIAVMPDHGHEGSLDSPVTYVATEWPSAASGYQPKPEVVAKGWSKLSTKPPHEVLIELISAYDGHQAGVGRIVAHTSFHHFVNVNLNGFLNPDDGSPNGALQSISEYYRNLASWLMPPTQRTKSLQGMMQWLPGVLRDLNGAPLELLGTAALKALRHYATRGQIQDLVFHAVEQVIPPTHERRSQQLPLPSLAYLVGGMVAESQRNPNPDSAVHGIRHALRTRLEELEAGARTMRGLLGDEPEPQAR
jgi:hypothetical protein